MKKRVKLQNMSMISCFCTCQIMRQKSSKEIVDFIRETRGTPIVFLLGFINYLLEIPEQLHYILQESFFRQSIFYVV